MFTQWRLYAPSVMEISRCNVIKDCFNCLSQRKHRNCGHFFSRVKCSEYLPSPFTYSAKRFLKLGTALLMGPVENFPHLLHCAFQFRSCVWKFQNSFDICMVFKFGELLGGRCPFSIICRQFSLRHCWATRAVRTEHHASCYTSALIGGGIKRWCCLTSVCRVHRA